MKQNPAGAVSIAPARKKDYRRIYEFQCEYLDEESFADFTARVENHPGLYLTAFAGDRLAGICYGEISRKKNDAAAAVLQGIAVDLDEKKGFARTGIGSALIRAFADAVAERGAEKIGVGSADDPKVEEFYLKNGFVPVELVVRDPRRRQEELERVPVRDLGIGRRKKLQMHKLHGRATCNLIFEKTLQKRAADPE